MSSKDISKLSDYAVLLTAMANEKRLHILILLLQSEMSVNTLAGIVGISQPAVSQHLNKLRRSNLVSTRRSAQMIYYSSDDDRVQKILGTLAAIAAGENVGFQSGKNLLEKNRA